MYKKMKKIIISAVAFLMAISGYSQTGDYDNGVVSMAGREGFSIQSADGGFVFKPYLLVQTAGRFNWYDDEGLDKAYNQDNIANSGFAIPYAVLGFNGKAFKRVSYNLSINAAASGAGILQQAWFDVSVNRAAAFRVGKFKTPFSHACLTTLGESLMPQMPVSLASQVIMPYSLNAVTPSIATGFDLGAQIHGLFGKFGYEAGIFNGTGSGSNSATKTASDDYHIPSMLYAGRISYMPKGVMPSTQGTPRLLNDDKILLALSASVNVESENESTNDFRAGMEFAWLHNRLYLGCELCYMHVGFTDRMKIDDTFGYLGGYAQAGYFVTDRLQVAARMDIYDRNGLDAHGFLDIPSIGINYFATGCNLKLSLMYQYTARQNHDTQLDRDIDNLGLATHSAVVMLQYAF